MKVHIIFAHEQRKSFNGALLDVAVKTLKDAGHEVTVSDLYAMKFNPVISQADIRDGVQNKDAYDYQTEVKQALSRGTLAADIKVEHKKIDAADLVIFQFPIQWYSYPAILKGYIERVFSNGFAFSFAPEMKIMEKGPFAKKRVLFSMTTGGFQSGYSSAGMHGDFSVYTWPMLMSMRLTGFQVLKPQISWSVKFGTDEQRKAMLTAWKDRLTGVWTEQPLPFFTLDNFDMAKGLQLKDDVIDKQKKIGHAPNIAQHLGLPKSDA